jgi:hypothetical protein
MSFKVKRMTYIWDLTGPLKQKLLENWGSIGNLEEIQTNGL